MNLPAVFRALPAIVRRDEATFARARAAQSELASYPTTTEVLDGLSLDAPLPLEERQELVRMLAGLYRREGHPLWPALLMHAFRPMLLALRARDRGPREDRDARIVLAFLHAVTRAPLAGQPVFLAVRRATERVLFQGVRRERVHAETVGLEEREERARPGWSEGGPWETVLLREVGRRMVVSTVAAPPASLSRTWASRDAPS